MTPATLEVGRPAKPTIVYDGQCRFCLKQIERIRGRDTREHFNYRARQDDGLESEFPQIAQGDFNTGLRLIETDGSVHVGADGVYHIARGLPRLWLAAWLYRVPGLRQLFRGIYAWIARNRFKLAGKCDDGGTCRL